MTNADNGAQRPDTDREGLLVRYPLTFYFIIAYALSWLVWAPLALSEDGAGLLSYRSPVGDICDYRYRFRWGPILSAFIMTGITEGRAGVGHLLRQFVLWRVGLEWSCAPYRPPRDHGAQRDPSAGSPVIVSRARWPGPSLPSLSLIVYVLFQESIGRRAGLARFRAAPPAAAARSFGRESNPRAPLGILAPAHILGSVLELPAHHPQHRHVCHCGHRLHDRHDVGLQQHKGQSSSSPSWGTRLLTWFCDRK